MLIVVRTFFLTCKMVHLDFQDRAYQTAEIIVNENNSLKLRYGDRPAAAAAISKDVRLRERSFGVLVRNHSFRSL